MGQQQLFSLIQGIFDVHEQRIKNGQMKTLYEREKRKLLDRRSSSEDYEEDREE